MRKVIAAVLFALGLMPAMANPAFDLGPAIGTQAPSLGQPLDAAGKSRTLDSLMGEKGLVLFFVRSASWCPYCKTQIIDLNSGFGEIGKRGYRLAGISYDKPEVQAAVTAEHQIKYPLLSDPQSAVIDRFKLRDPQYKPGSRAFGVPRPIILILDRKGVIRAKLYEETYRTRPPLPLILDALDKVTAR